jgi:hypothetical protein
MYSLRLKFLFLVDFFAVLNAASQHILGKVGQEAAFKTTKKDPERNV